jgi:hypothetical protein
LGVAGEAGAGVFAIPEKALVVDIGAVGTAGAAARLSEHVAVGESAGGDRPIMTWDFSSSAFSTIAREVSGRVAVL